MARSFGKKNVVSKNIFDYNIMLLGEAGVGKTTTMANVMRKFCKDDEYVCLQIGKEDGCKAISGLIWDSIPTWKSFKDFVNEVVTNREDWGTLRCVVLDTIDQLIDICTPAVIREWNQSNLGKKDFIPAKTLNQSWGGFGKADEYMMGLILDQIWKLKSVGVSVFIVGHTRRRDVVDPVSGLTYSTMSAAIPLKDFDALKTKMDIVSIAYIDREMTSKEFGRENIVTKKKSTINEVSNEARKIAFRSSAYVLDSKSRFPEIVDEVPMNADAFVQAIQDAIDAAAGENTEAVLTKAKKITKKVKAEEPVVEEDEEIDATPVQSDDVNEVETAPWDDDTDEEIDLFDEDNEDDEGAFDENAAKATIRPAFKAADAETKKIIKGILNGAKLADVHDEKTLKAILEALA
mgnify:CR=1 FL=1